MKNLKYLLVPLFMIIFVIITFLFGPIIIQNIKKADLKRKIISEFKKYKDEFNDSLSELDDYEYISFDKDNPVINVVYYDESGNKQKIKLLDNSFPKTQDLFNKFRIDSISKIKNNIVFHYKNAIHLSQNILYLNDLNEYKNSGHKIKNIKKIIDKWYYSEEN